MSRLFILLCCLLAINACASLNKPPVLLSPCAANEDGFNTKNPCVKRSVNNWLHSI